MVKSVLSVNRQGFRDWAIQRVTAILMAVYSVVLIAYLLCNPGLSFAEWHGLFSQNWIKVATLLFILSIFYHAWIGVWTVITDYINCFVVRALLNSLILLMLIACFFWGVLILWSV